ncbi:MAG: DegT/DnrJ/EryC1/StrS family aminotransferase [Bacteroidota bacterium]
MKVQNDKLSILGGKPAVTKENKELFHWPIITKRHEEAVMDVLRSGSMSGLGITTEFEEKYAKNLGRKYGLASPNGTASILSALYGMGVGVGDEVIVPSFTYWASVMQLYSLGATPVFADIEAETLGMDPSDIEHRITPRTKAIVVVHFSGMPAEMDAIMEIAERNNVGVLEDCSHAHGTLYKGKEVGTFGEAAAFSLMSVKSFAIGEGGILFTDDQRIHERAILFGHYRKHGEVGLEDLKKNIGVPCGGAKNRLNQISSAIGLVHLEMYPDWMAEIDKAMNYYCDQLEGTPGIRSIRPAKGSGSTKGGWYFPLFKYVPEELGGLSLTRFSDAVKAEGTTCNPGAYSPLHLHPAFTEMDIYGHGKPTRIAHYQGDDPDVLLKQSLPVTENMNPFVFEVPWFKHFMKEEIDQHVAAYRKVATNYKELLADDDKEKDRDIGSFSSAFSKDDL